MVMRPTASLVSHEHWPRWRGVRSAIVKPLLPAVQELFSEPSYQAPDPPSTVARASHGRRQIQKGTPVYGPPCHSPPPSKRNLISLKITPLLTRSSKIQSHRPSKSPLKSRFRPTDP